MTFPAVFSLPPSLALTTASLASGRRRGRGKKSPLAVGSSPSLPSPSFTEGEEEIGFCQKMILPPLPHSAALSSAIKNSIALFTGPKHLEGFFLPLPPFSRPLFRPAVPLDEWTAAAAAVSRRFPPSLRRNSLAKNLDSLPLSAVG